MGRSLSEIDDLYVAGDHWLIDDRTGERIRKSESVQEWNGAIVRRDDAEPRHPQEFVRGRADRQAVRPARPEAPDEFTGPPVSVTLYRHEAGEFEIPIEDASEFYGDNRVSLLLENGDSFTAVVGWVTRTRTLVLETPLPWAVTAGTIVTNMSRVPIVDAGEEIPAPAGARITAHPTGGFANEGTGQITLTATAKRATSLQWQSWNGSRWVDVDGATSTSLVLTPSDTLPSVYSLLARGAGGNARSRAATVAPYPSFFDYYRFAATDAKSRGITAVYSLSRILIDDYGAGPKYTLVGGNIGTVHNQTGDATLDFAQSTGANRPATGTINGRTVAVFDGSNDRLISSAQAQRFFNSAEAYIIVSFQTPGLAGDNEPLEPWKNDIVILDDGGNIGISLRQDPGSGSSTIQFVWWPTDPEPPDPFILEVVVPDSELIGTPVVAEMTVRLDELRGRVNGGDWSTLEFTPGFFAGYFNTMAINAPNSVGIATPNSQAEIIFSNVVPAPAQMDTLAADFGSWIAGGAGVAPWALNLPAFGWPWDETVALDQAFAIGLVTDCEVQYDKSGNGYARAFFLSTTNPDWIRAGRYYLMPQDDWNNTNRVEIEAASVRHQHGQSRWVAGKFKIDSSVQDDKALILQFHAEAQNNDDVDGTSAVFGFRYNWFTTGGRLHIDTNFSSTTPAGPGQVNTVWYDELCARGVWHDYVFEWCPDPTGEASVLRVWLDGTLIVNTTEPTGFTAADSYYLKFGVYNGVKDGVEPFLMYHAAMEADLTGAVYERVRYPRPNPD